MINIKLFARLIEVIGSANITVPPMRDTDELLAYLKACYPAFQESCFAIAVNRDIVTANTSLTADTEIALLPPYSGG